jgi:tetratricopeptide (TPR) repeat protein
MAGDYFDLGTHACSIATSSPQSQTWFDRGLMWMYGFNYEEAIACFKRALDSDQNCAMAHWGIAYALGPSYNKPWAKFSPPERAQDLGRAHNQAALARHCLTADSPAAEVGLVGALRHRYPSPTPAELPVMSEWNLAYANAMRDVYQAHRDHNEVATLFAEAVMNVNPRRFWEPEIDGPGSPVLALEIEEVLRHVFESPEGAYHPGALHLYIHLMEVSADPLRALIIADRLRGLVPDAGHLHHMPTHLDALAGDYASLVTWNTKAVEADRRYFECAGGMNFYTKERIHDLHAQIFGAIMLGQATLALATADEMIEAIDDKLLRTEVPPMADWLEGSVSMKLHVMIRFGMWDEILTMRLPADPALYCVTTAMTHYARGIAYAATGRVVEGERSREEFRKAVAVVSPRREVFRMPCTDLLHVASSMLDGELEYRKENYDEAFGFLREAIELDDAIPVHEPWGQLQPPRHAYGALLLEQGHVDQAAAVYRTDLGLDNAAPIFRRRPNNVWSLHGLHECLVRQGRADEAAVIRRQFEVASCRADVPIRASCACRTDTVGTTQSSCGRSTRAHSVSIPRGAL